MYAAHLYILHALLVTVERTPHPAAGASSRTS